MNITVIIDLWRKKIIVTIVIRDDKKFIWISMDKIHHLHKVDSLTCTHG